MGCRQSFFLISAPKYMKYLRPKLLQYYGVINFDKAIRQEYRKISQKVLFKSIAQEKIPRTRLFSENQLKGPLMKNLYNQHKPSQEMHKHVKEILFKHGKQIYYTKNHFLAMEDFLQSIDQFQHSASSIKVSNAIQVQNYLNYIKVVKQTIKKEQNEWNREYNGVDEAEQIFTDVLKRMKKRKVETYLYFRTGS